MRNKKCCKSLLSGVKRENNLEHDLALGGLRGFNQIVRKIGH
jgi:hypothetical protein